MTKFVLVDDLDNVLFEGTKEECFNERINNYPEDYDILRIVPLEYPRDTEGNK